MPTVHVFNEFRIDVISVAGVVIRPLRTVVNPDRVVARGPYVDNIVAFFASRVCA